GVGAAGIGDVPPVLAAPAPIPPVPTDFDVRARNLLGLSSVFPKTAGSARASIAMNRGVQPANANVEPANDAVGPASPLRRPVITVATIAERNGRFLMIEEQTRVGVRLNQPAGHVEIGESIAAAAARETLEEAAWRVEPT